MDKRTYVSRSSSLGLRGGKAPFKQCTHVWIMFLLKFCRYNPPVQTKSCLCLGRPDIQELVPLFLVAVAAGSKKAILH